MEEDAVSSGLGFFNDSLGGFKKKHVHLMVSAPGIGEHIIYTAAIQGIARLNAPALFVDCGNTFNPYEIARISMARGMEARKVLDKIHVSRPFTAYQLSTLFEDRAGVEKDLRREVEMLALLHPLKLIYSEDAAREDAEIILKRVLRRLRGLRRRDVAIVMSHQGPRRRHLARLMDAADYVYVLQDLGRHRVRVRLEKDPEMSFIERDFFLSPRAQTTIERFVERRR